MHRHPKHCTCLKKIFFFQLPVQMSSHVNLILLPKLNIFVVIIFKRIWYRSCAALFVHLRITSVTKLEEKKFVSQKAFWQKKETKNYVACFKSPNFDNMTFKEEIAYWAVSEKLCTGIINFKPCIRAINRRAWTSGWVSVGRERPGGFTANQK